MSALAMNLLPMFLNGGGGGISGILGNVTGTFGNLISGVGNTISQVGGNSNMTYNPTPKSNKKMFMVVGGLSFVMILGTIVIIVKKK